MEALSINIQSENSLRWLQAAHDLKSPLTALELITARLQTLPFEERSLIAQSIGRIQAIVSEILSNPSQPLTGVPCPSHQSAAWDLEQIYALLNEKRLEFPNVRFSLEIVNRGRPNTFVPAGAMTRVLSNLLNNAAEANDGSGAVFVRVSANESGYTISIEDQGPGIPEYVRAQIGALGISSKAAADGVIRGLGLHSAIQFANSLGGRLTVADREHAEGTRVCLELSANAK